MDGPTRFPSPPTAVPGSLAGLAQPSEASRLTRASRVGRRTFLIVSRRQLAVATMRLWPEGHHWALFYAILCGQWCECSSRIGERTL